LDALDDPQQSTRLKVALKKYVKRE